MPAPDYRRELAIALEEIRMILDSPDPRATPPEKIIRIAWSIGNLPSGIRDAIVSEAKNRVGIGWAAGLKPDKF